MKNLVVISTACLLGFAFSNQAQALLLTPETAPPVFLESGQLADNENEVMARPEYQGWNFIYKADRKDDFGTQEEGDLQNAFETTFNLDYLDPCSAEINFVGDEITFVTLYAFIKDGKADPAWYLFDITGWDLKNGPLQFENFWPGTEEGDRISHISIYAKTADVPDGGTTAAMLGLSLLGLRLLLRRKA